MITIIDYGMGNLRSVQKAIELLGNQAIITDQKSVIAKADKLILPGVGAFGKAMFNLKKYDLTGTIIDKAKQETPFLGICLGMQLLMDCSSEHQQQEGLKIIPGTVEYFRDNSLFDQKLSVPHMGWNQIQNKKNNKLFQGLTDNFYVYFVHSYYVKPSAATAIIGETNYGINFCSALNQKNIYGVQFHPEKSGPVGLTILKNFIEIL